MQRKPDTSRGFAPLLAADPAIQHANRECFRFDGRLDEAVLSPALHRLILGMARVRNVVSSLLLEGERVDFSQARQVLDSRSPTSTTEAETLRFLDKYQWVHETAPDRLPEPTLDVIQALHADLFKGMDGYDAGSLKTAPNGIRSRETGMMVFECTPPDRTEAEMAALHDWYANVKSAPAEVAVVGTWFAEFEAIHPFHDGNGRLGRLLALMLLKKSGLCNAPLVALDARLYRTQEKYYEKLAATNNGRNWHVWNRYFAGELLKAYRHAIGMADLRPVLQRQTSKPTRATLEWVLGRAGPDWFQRADLPNEEGFSQVALTKALADLVDQGVLEPRGEKRGRHYRLRTEYLERIFSGLEADTAAE